MFRHVNALAVGSALLLGGASTTQSQIPGAPVLQNAFANRGLAFAANFGAGGGQSLFALAAGWGLGNRLQVSGAAGAQRANDATRGAYGARAAFAAWTTRSGSIGVAAFGGVGGATRTRSGNVVTNPAVMTIPLGISAGYRRPLGGNKGLSFYAAPLYRWTRLSTETTGDANTSEGTFRVAAGVDFSLSATLGATAGAEFGSGGSSGSGSNNFGVAVTWVPGGARQ